MTPRSWRRETLPTYLSNIVETPPSMYVKSKEDVIDVLFEDIWKRMLATKNTQNESHFATNDVVTETNNTLVGQLPGEMSTFYNINPVGDDDDQTMFFTEF
ncbi:LOW QUALITY PROTEIN: hypothetical protein ACHAWF_001055 [Thalassiosira exigua]